MKIMSRKKCFKMQKTETLTKMTSTLTKIYAFIYQILHARMPKTGTFALFKIFSSQRGFLGVHLIKKD